jgi:hypothetical protein
MRKGSGVTTHFPAPAPFAETAVDDVAEVARLPMRCRIGADVAQADVARADGDQIERPSARSQRCNAGPPAR